MRDFNRGNRSVGRGDNRGSGRGFNGRGDNKKRSFSSRERDYNRDSDRSEMFKTVCDDCGKNCEVPFRPSGAKPVYCSDCYEKHGNGNDKKSFSKPEYKQNNSDNYEELKAQLREINKKLDALTAEIIKPKTVRIKK